MHRIVTVMAMSRRWRRGNIEVATAGARGIVVEADGGTLVLDVTEAQNAVKVISKGPMFPGVVVCNDSGEETIVQVVETPEDCNMLALEVGDSIPLVLSPSDMKFVGKALNFALTDATE